MKRVCGAPRQAAISPKARRAGAFVGMGRDGKGLETSTDHLLLTGEGPKEERAGHAQRVMAPRHEACFKRDPPEEPPSEERYSAEGRSPGLRVNAAVPAFPSFLQKPSDTKWNRYSPLTVAGAAPDSAPKGTTGFPS